MFVPVVFFVIGLSGLALSIVLSECGVVASGVIVEIQRSSKMRQTKSLFVEFQPKNVTAPQVFKYLIGASWFSFSIGQSVEIRYFSLCPNLFVIKSDKSPFILFTGFIVFGLVPIWVFL